MNLLNAVLLMAPPSGQAGDQSPLPTFLMMGAIVLVFWLFMIRPQAKKAKEQKKFKHIQPSLKCLSVSVLFELFKI